MLTVCFMGILMWGSAIEGSQPTLQKTVEALFRYRSEVIHPGACHIVASSPHQSKICRKDVGLPKVLTVARDQAVTACEEAFQFDRWNCSLLYNNKVKKAIFNSIYRETAFIYALVAASMTHAVAKGCASGELSRCSCFGKAKNFTWKLSGCDDNFRYGKKFTKNFLELKRAGSDQIGEMLRQDVVVGIDSVGEQLREVCKCHGFSGSCTTKTCWRRLGPFNSALGLLKKHYHHAVRRKIVNYTTKRAISPKVKRRLEQDLRSLVYLQKTPNLCVSTKGRICKDKNNCATLCCGRGFVTAKKLVRSRCRCKMVSCCLVECDTCSKGVEYYICK